MPDEPSTGWNTAGTHHVTPTPLVLFMLGEEFARLNADGTVTLDWPAMHTAARMFDPVKPDQAVFIARLVWGAIMLEREACAKLAESKRDNEQSDYGAGATRAAEDIADAIRDR